MIFRWLDRRAWRIVLDPTSRDPRLTRARAWIRRRTIVQDIFDKS